MSSKPAMHFKARSSHPDYPARTPVPETMVSWEKDWPDYNPKEFTHPAVIANNREIKPNGWADPPEISIDQIESRLTHCGRKISIGPDGLPRNPVGRTGMRGRGLLGKWGPNHAADPIVTRINPTTNKLEMVAIKRRDTKEWAIPGGMVDDGELVSATVKREFSEEAMGNHSLSDSSKAFIREQLDALFASGGMEVFRGYVDDPRNTDNAWMETVAMHFHCPPPLAPHLHLEAADDAMGVMWLQIEDNNDALSRLYASHQTFVERVLVAFQQPVSKSPHLRSTVPVPSETDALTANLLENTEQQNNRKLFGYAAVALVALVVVVVVVVVASKQ